MKKEVRSLSIVFVLLLLVPMLSGCATNYIRTVKGELRVESKMSETIFLDPLSPQERTAFVRVRNTSGKSELFEVNNEVITAVTAAGYQVTNNPDDANVLLQVNILSLERTSLDGAESARRHGFAGPNTATTAAVAGGFLGSAVTRGDGDNPVGEAAGAFAGSLLFGLIGSSVDANTQDVTYALVTDVQISTREQGEIEYKGSQNLQQGSSGSEVANYTKKRPWIRYRTRVVTTANKINLELAEATPEMRGNLASTLGGLL